MITPLMMVDRQIASTSGHVKYLQLMCWNAITATGSKPRQVPIADEIKQHHPERLPVWDLRILIDIKRLRANINDSTVKVTDCCKMPVSRAWLSALDMPPSVLLPLT
jgi:hypothetical protein